MRAAIVAGMVVAALATAAPAAAFTEAEQRFIDRMYELGITAHHGHIEDHAREDRNSLNLGLDVCRNLANGYSDIDVRRNLLVNSHTRHAMGQDPLGIDGVNQLVDSAKEILCP